MVSEMRHWAVLGRELGTEVASAGAVAAEEGDNENCLNYVLWTVAAAVD